MGVLDCYGADAPALASLGGSFDASREDSFQPWWLRQWELVASRLGWGEQFAHTVGSVADAHVQQAPLAAFREWHKHRSRQLSVGGAWDNDQLGRVRYDVLQALRQRAGTWTVAAPSYELPVNACAGRFRVFTSPARPTYFDDGLADSTPRTRMCSWPGNVRMYFGTWPWCSGRLDPFAEGLAWTWQEHADPATLAMRTAASCFVPSQNARIDARVVVEHWARFKQFTAPLINRLPTLPGAPGSVYRDGLRLQVHLGSLDTASLNGPRGPIGVQAYNYVIERFAAYWACRRSLLTHFHKLPASIRASLLAKPDPCVREAAKPKPQIVGGLKGS